MYEQCMYASPLISFCEYLALGQGTFTGEETDQRV